MMKIFQESRQALFLIHDNLPVFYIERKIGKIMI